MSVLLVDETRVPKEKYIITDFERHCYLTALLSVWSGAMDCVLVSSVIDQGF
jgi:hypothetical protein